MTYNLRKLVRNKRHLDAISRTEIDNLRNRLEASRKSRNYNQRTHVDVPSDLLERIITALDGLIPSSVRVPAISEGEKHEEA